MKNTGWNTIAALAVAVLALVAAGVFVSPTLAQDDARERGPEAKSEVKVAPKVVLPDGPHREVEWVLGITGQITDTGVRVREVLPHTAAARSGLEPDDVIVAVNGFQVGRVDGRLFDLDDEMQLRADLRGRVLLLVQDRRTDRLLNLEVFLDRRSSAPIGIIPGQVVYRERMTLPSNAELRLTMRRRTFVDMETVAEEVYRNIGNSPIPFEFPYPMNKVHPGETYYLSAEIWSGNRRLFVTPDPYILKLDEQAGAIQIMVRRDR